MFTIKITIALPPTLHSGDAKTHAMTKSHASKAFMYNTENQLSNGLLLQPMVSCQPHSGQHNYHERVSIGRSNSQQCVILHSFVWYGAPIHFRTRVPRLSIRDVLLQVAGFKIYVCRVELSGIDRRDRPQE